MVKRRYARSEAMLKRALKTIPLGSQTFSKSRTQFPYGVSPYFATHGKGSRIWDVDGNAYTDFVNALAAVTLGYCDPDVDAAVKRQLAKGALFSLSHPLEHAVAEKIVKLVPCAEKVRFGKNGSDATAGAIRLARAFTGREHVAVCGYHGWQDWYIGSTSRHRGVPVSTRSLTHRFNFNDEESLRRLFRSQPGKIAAVIMEPMNHTFPAKNFLQNVKALTHRHGALLVFDETITGFRFAKGGAQEYFKVTPDLATFGKGLGNGHPLSAVAGRADVMQLMEEVFFSFTAGGETLSLAAALAVLTKLETKPVIERLRGQGQKVVDGVSERIRRFRLDAVLGVQGHPSWSFLMIKNTGPYSPPQIQTLFMQEMLKRGILILTTHNMTYAHTDSDIRRLLKAYDEVLPILRETIVNKTLERRLKCEPLVPLFKVR